MVRVERRRELAAEGKMGCPNADPPRYPLDSKPHVKAAASRYKQEQTIKCQGFWGRWCKAANRVGLDTPLVEEKCK